MTETKRCSKCGETKELAQFCKNHSKPGGVESCCLLCKRQINKNNYTTNADYKQYAVLKDRQVGIEPGSVAFFQRVARQLLYRNGKAVGRNSGRAVMLVPLLQSICTENCPLCGVELIYARGGNTHIDHILPRKTHPELALKLSNLRWLCATCNKAKAAGSDEELKAWVLRAAGHMAAV